jgi:hypothetical protein
MRRLLALLLLFCLPLGAAASPPGWKIDLHSEDLENFDRDIDAFWMNQQGVLFLSPTRVVVYQVKRSSEPAKLAPRGASGGTGNFILGIKVFSVDNGSLIKSLELPTSGTVSAVMATRAGQFLVRTGNSLYLYSKEFSPLASRVLRSDKPAEGEGWQVNVTPSGAEVVLLHEQDAPAASKDSPADDDDTQGKVEILDSDTLQLKKTFTLSHLPVFWTPADDLVLSSDPHAQSDRPVGMLDFDGKWSPMPAAFERPKAVCHSSVGAIDRHRIILYGCDAFSVFSTDGKRLFSRNDERFIFRSIAANGSYLAAACDHYRLGSDTPDGDAFATTRPDRIEVYDLDRHARVLSFRVRSLRVYYAISLEGDLAVIDGANLEMIRARR